METKQLKLIACDRSILEAALKSNEDLGAYLNVTVPEQWSEFGNSALNYALAQINAGESQNGWWTYLPIHKADNILIGSCGYKGSPDEHGAVEIGYEIKAEYRNRGLATELANALIKNAFENKSVNSVQAHTLGEVNASTKVLGKCGFVKTEELNDPDQGSIWKWELRRR